MNIAVRTDSGNVREKNEDWYIVDEETGLFLVADGVGGSAAGEVASKKASEKIQEQLKRGLENSETDDAVIRAALEDAINSAHKEVSALAEGDIELAGMGTTIVLGLYRNNKLYVAHVGDSRAYLINSKGIAQLTEDHSFVMNLVKMGEITREEARTHPRRNVVTQCVGSNGYVGPELSSFDINKGDVFLICSDGLSDMVDDDEIERIVLKAKDGHDLESIADELVGQANGSGGKDNITLILVAYDDFKLKSRGNN